MARARQSDFLTRERRVQHELDVALESAGDRAAFLRPVCDLLELRLVDARHAGVHRQLGGGDLRPLVGVEGHLGAHLHTLGRVTRLRQPVRERHGEAGRVRGGDQLLRARLAGGTSGARGPGHLLLAERPAVGGNAAAAMGQVAFPDRLRLAPRTWHLTTSWNAACGRTSTRARARAAWPSLASSGTWWAPCSARSA